MELRNALAASSKRFLPFQFLAIFLMLNFLFFLNINLTFASESVGTIHNIFKNAWGENIGWINFGCDNCNVSVTDAGLSGNAWSSQYGWINLNPTTAGVTNNGEGLLAGFAWSSNLGWIDFDGVTINNNGEFLGYAMVKTGGSRINFNCINEGSCGLSNFKVKTDWRPESARTASGGGENVRGGGGRKGSRNDEIINIPPSFPPIEIPPTPPSNITPPSPLPTINPPNLIDNIFNFFFPPKIPEPPVIVTVPQIAPPAFAAGWNLLPVVAIREFVFAPLPQEVLILASKFPELGKTLQSVGINRLTDLSKLSGVNLGLPGLSELTNTLRGVGAERLGEIDKLKGVTLEIPGLSNLNEKISNLGVGVGGKIALIQGLPLAKFSLVDKKNLPAEFVFARVAAELVDLNVVMSIGDQGEVIQKISSLPGKTMRLVVKPISAAKSVTGYFVFKSATPRISTETETGIPRSSLSASALFSMNDLVQNVPSPVPVENKLVLSSFEYTDPEHDGIYTADVVTPATPGQYEVITVIDYIDPQLGTRQMRMIAVVDPEGYVFEKNNGKETRIPSAIVSLYYLNVSTKQYELWPAKEYSQENPQITDVRGTYAFLVPEGSYYFSVEAPGYDSYQGKAFVVTTGAGIHDNIELISGRGWFAKLLPDSFSPQTILLVVVFLLLVYNLYRNRLRDKLFKQLENKSK
ncbi:MAG TPA: carboxypeptidase-like regulatory domain-containing protein [Candidatus Paceibacterota bacterium]|nr:carboxypeptidase-like regulatory domain-containing protein [Candidatus Paceibacterota bacterium]